MEFYTFKIEKPQSVYYFLKESGFSEKYITLLRKEKGLILIDEKPATTRSNLERGNTLKISKEAKMTSSFQALELELNILYEDEDYLAVFKSSNLATTPSKRHYGHNLSGAILNYLKKSTQKPVVRILNRLDKDTSGIILAAKNTLAYNKISNVNKVYHAICTGQILTEITINQPILTVVNNGINQLKRVISKDGKPAETNVIPLKIYSNKTLLKITLKHGRTHQIRVHLASINHPILGDQVYGQKSEKISHTALICKEISFFHPFKEKQICLKCDYEEDFKNLL